MAPTCGWSPVCVVRSMRSTASRAPLTSATASAPCGAAIVNTLRPWSGSECVSSSLAGANATPIASMAPPSRPSLTLGTAIRIGIALSFLNDPAIKHTRRMPILVVMGKSRNVRAGQSGFTLVEVMVAMALLLTAVLGLMSLSDSAARTTTDTKAREGAINLEREVLEDAGGIAYSQLSPATLVPSLQALPGLTPQGGGGWTVTRRDATGAAPFTYTVDATMCSIDDVSDGYGSRAGVTWCDSTVPSGTADSQPEDFKRVAVTVTWTARGQAHSVRQTALFAKNGAPDLPVVNTLVLTTPSVSNPPNPTY